MKVLYDCVMKIVVTGVAGLLGSHYSRWMADLGHEVIGIDNLSGGYESNIPRNIEFIQEDILNTSQMVNVLKDAKIVFHAACAAYEGLSVFSPNNITLNTFQSSISIASAAIANDVEKFIYCSSMARYGTQNQTPFVEDMIPRPQDPYGISKLAAEHTILNLSKVHGMKTVILVPHNIYGPGQKFDDPYRNVASIMINRILHGQSPIIYGDGMQTRCFTHINDIKDSLINATFDSGVDGEVVNIGPDEETITILELFELIKKLMKFEGKPIFFAERPQEVKHATCSANKSRELLGYKSNISLEEGIKDLITWIEHSPRRDFKYDIELEIKNSLTPITWLKKEI
jgi:UDP-glucose 4-epimerase